MDSIHASGGRVLTRARTISVLVRDGRAAGVCVGREPSGSSSGSGPKGQTVEVLIATGGGSVISSIGVIDSFRHLIPATGAAVVAAAVAAGADKASGGAASGGKKGSEGGGEGGGGGGDQPEGFRDLRAARPRVHLCVGLQGNWLEDLEGTCAYFHHVS